MATLTLERIEPPVTFSENALNEVRRIRKDDEIPASKLLRVGVKGGGCSGMSYVLDFDEPGEFDQLFEIEGVQMIMDKRHGMYLFNMSVDFEYGLNARGFMFDNPNATESCGCGTSFGV